MLRALVIVMLSSMPWFLTGVKRNIARRSRAIFTSHEHLDRAGSVDIRAFRQLLRSLQTPAPRGHPDKIGPLCEVEGGRQFPRDVRWMELGVRDHNGRGDDVHAIHHSSLWIDCTSFASTSFC